MADQEGSIATVNPDRPKSPDNNVPLLRGEKIIIVDQDVTYLCPFNGPRHGTLSITNFKVSFEGDKDPGSDDVTLEVPLGMIERVAKVGGSKTSGEHSYGLDLHCKDLRRLRFAHRNQPHARKPVFDSLTEHAFPVDAKNPFFAFLYDVTPNETPGWSIYDFTREMRRQGVPNDQWRITSINEDYSASPTYPALNMVPESISDDQLRRVCGFRSKGRFPALSWVHPRNQSSLTRCSQPQVGFQGKRCAEDEALFEAFRTMNPNNNELLHIMDARPRLNAKANQVKGYGYESKENYTGAEVEFLNIHNIHAMRESLQRLRDLCFPNTDDLHWLSGLENTQWLKHVKCVLVGSAAIADRLEKGESVVIHCSDGWDRTAQLSSLSMLLLDPYYRTIEGLEVLIEKEWLSFGHKFGERYGHGDGHYENSQRSPIFVQFIDCVWQIMQQHPCAFQFNEWLLITILDHMYSCLFGTFLYDNECARVRQQVRIKTNSLWDYINKDTSEYLNPFYSPKASEVLVIKANIRNLRLWTGYYLRWNPRMRPEESILDRTKELQQICDKLEAQYQSQIEEMAQQQENNEESET